MDVLQMSLSGAVLIVVVLIIRALTFNLLPKNTFLILWGVVLLRLLVPFSIPSPLSVYSVIGRINAFELQVEGAAGQADVSSITRGGELQPGSRISASYEDKQQGVTRNLAGDKQQQSIPTDTTKNREQQNISKGITDNKGQQSYSVPDRTDHEKSGQTSMMRAAYDTIQHGARILRKAFVFRVIWCVGMMICVAYFAVSYLRCRYEFQTSLPVKRAFVQQWLAGHPQRRLVLVRQSDRISTPLTYGIIRPVILLPKGTDWSNTRQLQYVLMHEWIHIRRCDTLTKLLMTSALCVHWFNPAVWLMYILFNRDVEISCDESVVRRMGETSKRAYAMTLIQMEAERSGLMPFCNGFLSKNSKNAMEERIKAIMKIRKKSTLAGIVAAVLVVSVTTAFATSATNAAEQNKTAQTTEAGKAVKTANKDEIAKVSGTAGSIDFTEQEYELLLELQFDGYEDMRISEFRDKVWAMTDTQAYNDLLERFFQDENLYLKYESREGTDSDEISSFLYGVLSPLLLEDNAPSFNGCATTDFSGETDHFILEYSVVLTVLNPYRLTVHAYDTARQGVMGELKNLLADKTADELREAEQMQSFLDGAIREIMTRYQNENLQIDVEYAYMPLDAGTIEDPFTEASAMSYWQSKWEWENAVAPYTPYGLSYHYDQQDDDFKMYYQGTQVRSIYDGEKGIYITEHTGNSTFDENAIELIAVYENGMLAGLRKATAQEMQESTERRVQGTDPDETTQMTAQPVRAYLPATEQDYQSLLALKTADYRAKSIADFNSAVLDWADADYDRMERIGCDLGWDDCRVTLSNEEKRFVSLTAWLSRLENAEYVRSLMKNAPERDVFVDITLPGREAYAGNGNANAWCTLWYTFSYHIADKEKVSVGRRDDQIGGMIDEIQNYWESTGLDQLLAMTDSDMRELLHSVAAKYSTRDVVITIQDDYVSFECMDERLIPTTGRELD